MERTERIALLHGLLTRNRDGLSNDRLMRETECSKPARVSAVSV